MSPVRVRREPSTTPAAVLIHGSTCAWDHIVLVQLYLVLALLPGERDTQEIGFVGWFWLAHFALLRIKKLASLVIKADSEPRDMLQSFGTLPGGR